MTISKQLVRNFALGAVLAVAAGSAAVAAGAPKEGALPPELSAPGDRDGACMFVQMEAWSLVSRNPGNYPKDKQTQTLEELLRLSVYFGGRIAGQFPADKAKAQIQRTSKLFDGPLKDLKRQPLGLSCFKSAEAVVQDYSKHIGGAMKIVAQLDKDKAPQATLDPDAHCLASIAMAIPGTAEAAKTNPKAADGLNDLVRAQNYFIGKLDARGLTPTIEPILAGGLRYNMKLFDADLPALEKHGYACISTYKDNFLALLDSIDSKSGEGK